MDKILIIGIDGVPYGLLDEFSRTGIMPSIARIRGRGIFKKTKAPIPAVSSVSWTSFMTAANPGEHGIFGFEEIDPETYEYRFHSFSEVKLKTFWERKNRRAIVINLPQTYPAVPINGILISGFVAPDIKKAVYPPSLLPVLIKMGYKVDVDFSLARDKKRDFIKELRRALSIRMKLAENLWKEEWNIFFFVITGTDRLHHFLFDAYEHPEHEFRRDFEEYYRLVDKVVGKLFKKAREENVPAVVLSDHGFCGVRKEVYINSYLQEWGYLHIGDVSQGLKSLEPSTTAFALNPARIYIHLKGKYSRGKVEKKDYEKLVEELKRRFLSIEIEGDSPISKVFHKEEIYSGSYLDRAPDLLLLSKRGYDLKAGFREGKLFGTSHFKGMHTQDDAFVLSSIHLDFAEQPFIYEVSQKIEQLI